MVDAAKQARTMADLDVENRRLRAQIARAVEGLCLCMEAFGCEPSGGMAECAVCHGVRALIAELSPTKG